MTGKPVQVMGTGRGAGCPEKPQGNPQYSCYDFSFTRVEHTFSFLLDDNLTLAATCADGSPFISVLLLT